MILSWRGSGIRSAAFIRLPARRAGDTGIQRDAGRCAASQPIAGIDTGIANDAAAAAAVLDACMELLARRYSSLADRPVYYPQPVHFNGRT